MSYETYFLMISYCSLIAFNFLSSSLGDNWKNLGGNYFKNLSQEFESEVSELVKKKGFYLFKYMCNLNININLNKFKYKV